MTAAGLLMGAGWVYAGNDAVPLGHKDFYPSPERPVGWRGDGNGAFPGATPVTFWREGTVAMVEKEIAQWGDAGGNLRGTFKKQKVPVFADQNAVNIVWKTEMPGFAHSQPIVVGDRAFTTADPNFLVCVDVNTGKILWQQELDVFELMGQAPEEAKKNRRLLDLSRAVSAVVYNIVNNYIRVNPNVMVDNLPRWRENLAELRGSLTAALPIDTRGDIQRTIEAIDAAVVEMDLALKRKEWDSDSRKEVAGKLLPLVKAILGKFDFGWQQISAWMIKEYDLHPTGHWTSWVGWTFATPVSDGRHVFVTFGHHQAACFDLSGKLIWAQKVPLPKGDKGSGFDARDLKHGSSPILTDGVLTMQFPTGVMVGLDQKTGKTVWERPERTNLATGKALRLKDGTQVLVRSNGQVIRLKDGVILVTPTGLRTDHNLPASIIGIDDIFYYPNNPKGNGPCHLEAFRCEQKISGVELTQLWRFPKEENGRMGSGNSPILTDRYIIHPQGSIVDRATGEELAVKENGTRFKTGIFRTDASPILAGDVVIVLGSANSRQTTPGMVERAGDIMCPSWALKLDPDGKLTKISEDNYLGGANLPRMQALETYVPKAYAKGLWSRDGEGVPDNFGSGSPFAQGNRIFIRSSSHLYCIGDPKVPYDWNPSSRPADISATLKSK